MKHLTARPKKHRKTTIHLQSKAGREHTHRFLPSWMTKAATMAEQRRSHIRSRLWHRLKGRGGRSWNVHILIANIMPRTCATTAIIGKEKRKKPMHANTRIKATTPVACARTATWPSTISKGKRKEMPKMKWVANLYYQPNQFKIIIKDKS